MEGIVGLFWVWLLVENIIRVASYLSSAVGMAVQILLRLDVMLRQERKNRLSLVWSCGAGSLSFATLRGV